MRETFSSIEVVTVAVLLLGGDSRSIDTEDIAIKTRDIAPGRFAWRRHPDQVNLELVRVALSDAKKPENGTLVTGSGNEGWLLTEEGLRLARSRIASLPRTSLGRRTTHARDRLWQERERVRMLATAAFRKYKDGLLLEITPQEAETFFHLDSYVRGMPREQKIRKLLMAFDNDSELGGAVRSIRERLTSP
jgi:hypothetical protein